MNVYLKTRSKELLETRSSLNLPISYQKVIQIQIQIANVVYNVIDENKG